MTLTAATNWSIADPVGRCSLTWHRVDGAAPHFVVRNNLGSGSMQAHCNLPTRPYPDIAGWEFDVKRSAKAQFNFHFSLGRKDAKGIYKPSHHFFQRLFGLHRFFF